MLITVAVVLIIVALLIFIIRGRVGR